MSVTVKEADMEASLNALQCHFTWGIDKADIGDLKAISEKLPEHIKFGHARCHPTYFNILAFLSHLEGDSGLALGFLNNAEKVLRERRDDTELLVTYGNYAWVHYHNGNVTEVKVYLKKLDEIYQAHPKASENPCDLPNIHGEKGWTFLRLGVNFYERARDSFEKALEGAPDSVSFNVGYANTLYCLEGLVKDGRRGRRKKPGEATGQLRKVLEMEPDNAKIMVLLALELQSQSTGTQEPMELVQQALILAPDVPQVTRCVVKFLRLGGSIEQSLGMLHKALEVSPTSSFLHHQVGLCQRHQLIKMQELGRGGPDDLGGWRSLGWGMPMAKLKAKAEECILHFSRAVELMPSNIHARLNLAESYGESGRMEEAAEIKSRRMEEATKIYRSLEKDQSLRESDRQQVLLKYGQFLLYRMRNEDAAVARLKAAYQIPVQGFDRKCAEKKLRTLAEKWETRKPQDAQDILTFLGDQDHLERGCPSGLGRGIPVGMQMAELKAKADECTLHFSRAVELMPSNIHTRLNHTEAYGESGLMGEANGHLRKALELEPDKAVGMVLLALELQSQSTGTQEPMELVQQALILAPDVPRVGLFVARFFSNEGSIEQSLEVLRKALELSPTSSFLHHQVGICHRRELIKLQQLVGGPGGLGGWRPVGEGMAKLKAKAEECILHFSRAVELMPSNIHARLNLAEAYGESARVEEAAEIKSRQLEEAAKIYCSLEQDQSLRESDRQQVLDSYALFLLHRMKNEDAAVAQLKAAYQIPGRGFGRERVEKTLRMLAEVWDKRKPQEAQDILTFLSDQDNLDMERLMTEKRRDVELMPWNIHAHLNLAEAYGESGQMEEATGQLRKALELEPDNAEVMVLLALELQSQSTGTEEPMELVQQALILAPDVPQVTHRVAKFLRLEGSIEQSLGMLHKVLELTPTSSFLHHQVGLCHSKQLIKMQQLGTGGRGGLGGRRPMGTPMAKLKAKAEKAKAEECIVHFSRAVELMPSNILARLNLAEAYGESGRMEEATEIYRCLEKDQSLRESDRQQVHGSYGLFLFYKMKNEAAAVAQLKAAYQIPVQGFDREQAGKKLRMLAERWDKERPQDAQDILTFLSDQDNLERGGIDDREEEVEMLMT